jgi:arylsulfatase A-like enzyme
VLDGAALRQAQAGYFGLIRQIDELLPGLLGAFKRKSAAMRRPWIVVFTSDHGEMLGDHYLFRKCEPYEGSSRIPFLIQGSRKLGFASGRKCNQPVCLEDIMPTLLDLAGVPIPGHVEGKSLLPILRGKRVALRARLHGEHSPCYDQAQAYHFLTDGRMKYIWRPHDGSEQLFDLQSDPQELRDLARRRDRSAARSQWRRAMVAHLKNRPEGFSDGKRLFAGRAYDAVMPHARPSLQ